MADYNNEEKVFADGFSFKRQENAPDFVVGRLSVKCDEAVAFMKSHQKNGWLNLNINCFSLFSWLPSIKFHIRLTVLVFNHNLEGGVFEDTSFFYPMSDKITYRLFILFIISILFFFIV